MVRTSWFRHVEIGNVKGYLYSTRERDQVAKFSSGDLSEIRLLELPRFAHAFGTLRSQGPETPRGGLDSTSKNCAVGKRPKLRQKKSRHCAGKPHPRLKASSVGPGQKREASLKSTAHAHWPYALGFLVKESPLHLCGALASR